MTKKPGNRGGRRRNSLKNIVEFLSPEAWISETPGPRYLRLRRRIEEGIESGLLEPNDSLPSEREIATLTGLSRVTVRKAMRDLVDQGSIIQRQGSGSFVTARAPHVEQSLSRLTSFTEEMASRGLVSGSRWLDGGVFMPSPDEQVALALSSSDSVSRIARLRLAGEQPMAIERASLPTSILPDPSLVKKSLYEVLDKSGNRPVRALQKISAINLGRQDAELLNIDEYAAGLRIERISYLSGGRAAEFTRSIYRGDAYDFVTELLLAKN